MQYIGQTSNPLHLRINLHRSNIKNYNNSENNKNHNFEFQHYKVHDFKNITITVIDIIKDHKDRLFHENKYIYLHKTMFPYGLNQIYNNHLIPNISIWTKYQIRNTIYNFLFHSKNNHNANCKAKRFKRGNKKGAITKYKNFDIKNEFNNLLNTFKENYNISKIKNGFSPLKKSLLVKFSIISKIT